MISLYLVLSLYLAPFGSISGSLALSFNVSRSLSLSLSITLPLSLSLSLSLCLSLSLSFSLSPSHLSTPKASQVFENPWMEFIVEMRCRLSIQNASFVLHASDSSPSYWMMLWQRTRLTGGKAAFHSV